MEFILIDVQNIKRSVMVKKYDVIDSKKITEIVLSKSKINYIANLKLKDNNNFIDKIRVRLFEAKLRNIMKKLNAEIKYILAENLNKTDRCIKYLMSFMEELGVTQLPCLNEMNINVFKYIDEHSIKNKINMQDIKMLCVYKDENNIDLNLITEAIRCCKKVNIYLKSSATKEIINNIDNINNSEGSVIEIIKYNKKAFVDYDVIYFADDYRLNYPRMRFNKKSCVIDLEDALKDKFNSNIINFNKLENKRDIIGYIVKVYGLLSTAYALRQM